MNGFQLLQCGLSVAALLGGSALAASPAVYPVPQQSKLSSQTVAFSGKPSVVIRSAKTAASKLLNGVPEKSGAYKLVVSPQGKVAIGAHDERGAFYAMQTLRQLGTKAGGEGVTLPVGEITDWPDIEFRGTVEGFYGTPWSHEARLSQLRFYGQNKMNTYIYGPKDDPYHSSPTGGTPIPRTRPPRSRNW
ncbi:beta-N-acetylglucosaminidase domain-containing protein [Akkermansia massiliensis]